MQVGNKGAIDRIIKYDVFINSYILVKGNYLERAIDKFRSRFSFNVDLLKLKNKTRPQLFPLSWIYGISREIALHFVGVPLNPPEKIYKRCIPIA
jgi:hypothetical protein